MLRAGLVDRIRLRLAPVLLGGRPPTALEPIEVTPADDVVHLRYRVPR